MRLCLPVKKKKRACWDSGGVLWEKIKTVIWLFPLMALHQAHLAKTKPSRVQSERWQNQLKGHFGGCSLWPCCKEAAWITVACPKKSGNQGTAGGGGVNPASPSAIVSHCVALHRGTTCTFVLLWFFPPAAAQTAAVGVTVEQVGPRRRDVFSVAVTVYFKLTATLLKLYRA